MPTRAHAAAVLILAATLASLGALAPSGPGAPAFPKWIHGGDCQNDPLIQVHRFEENTYILRQSLCTHFEGPFMYLLFGEDKVLLQDTGAGGAPNPPVAATVYAIIDDWLREHDKRSIDLVVTHSHGHGDHVAGDSQFAGKPNTVVVGKDVNDVKAFFGITDWPAQTVAYDLGGRVVDVIPIPGHQASHIALYDARTDLLFTGDTLYPGRLYFPKASLATYLASIQRLVDFTADRPVRYVLGTHIEMTKEPGVDFAFGVKFHPNEHVLQLRRKHLVELLDALKAMNGVPKLEKHDDFIIYPT